MAKSPKYYVVWRGRKTGIFNTWDECRAQVLMFEGASYKSYPTREEAEAAFRQPTLPSSGNSGKPASPKSTLKTPGRSIAHPIRESLCVDAACSGNPGAMEYRGVHCASGEEIFYQGIFQDGTNNIGEFLALVHGLALLKQENSQMPIYCDSKTAMAWVKKGKANTSIQPNAKNAPIFELIARAEKWLSLNTYTTVILKWETEVWGEIPADFGRK